MCEPPETGYFLAVRKKLQKIGQYYFRRLGKNAENMTELLSAAT
jgi:hypothetical protein